MPKLDLVVICVSEPSLFGVYDDGKLIEKYQYDLRTLDSLSSFFDMFLSSGRSIDNIIYARGPGSFTALKLTHIFLHTLSITKGVNLKSIDSFFFNQNSPIRAFGNKYFFKIGDEIVLKSLDQPIEPSKYVLPENIVIDDFYTENSPLYVLPPL